MPKALPAPAPSTRHSAFARTIPERGPHTPSAPEPIPSGHGPASSRDAGAANRIFRNSTQNDLRIRAASESAANTPPVPPKPFGRRRSINGIQPATCGRRMREQSSPAPHRVSRSKKTVYTPLDSSRPEEAETRRPFGVPVLPYNGIEHLPGESLPNEPDPDMPPSAAVADAERKKKSAMEQDAEGKGIKPYIAA